MESWQTASRRLSSTSTSTSVGTRGVAFYGSDHAWAFGQALVAIWSGACFAFVLTIIVAAIAAGMF